MCSKVCRPITMFVSDTVDKVLKKPQQINGHAKMAGR